MKQFALYRSIAIGVRIQHYEGAGIPWIRQHQREWIHTTSELPPHIENADQLLRRYLVDIGLQEGWISSPFLREHFDVIHDTVKLILQRGLASELCSKAFEEADCHDWLTKFKRIIIIGPPGSGKTVLTKQAVSTLTRLQLSAQPS